MQHEPLSNHIIMKKFFIYFFVLTLAQNSFSQRLTDEEKRFAVSVKFGSTDYPIGGDFVYQCKPKLALRFGYSPFKNSTFESNTNIGDKPVYLKGTMNLTNWNALFELGGAFHFNFGVTGITSKDFITANINLKTNNAGGNVIISNTSGIKPTIGFGFGRPIPRSRLGFGIDFNGIYVKDGFDVTTHEGSAPFKYHLPKAKIESHLDNTFQNLKNIIPSIKFRTTIRIK